MGPWEMTRLINKYTYDASCVNKNIAKRSSFIKVIFGSCYETFFIINTQKTTSFHVVLAVNIIIITEF